MANKEAYIKVYKKFFMSKDDQKLQKIDLIFEDKKYWEIIGELRKIILENKIKSIRNKINSIKNSDDMANIFLKHLNKSFSYEELRDILIDDKENRQPNYNIYSSDFHISTKIELSEKQKNYKILDRLETLASWTYGRILCEDISNIVKKYPLMALEKSFILKSFYNFFKENTFDPENDIFYKHKSDIFYRGCLFKKNETPFTEKIPYLRMTQPPEDKANIGRFNIGGQSRFYLTDKSYGIYFELRKFEKEHKEERIFIQTFRVTEKFANAKIINLGKFLIPEWEKVRNLEEQVFKEIKSESLRENYNISNYLADIVQSASPDYLGVSYPSARFNNDSRKRSYSSVLDFKKFYTNLTFFSDFWDFEEYKMKRANEMNGEDFSVLKSKLDKFRSYLVANKTNIIEAKDYFYPVETELREYKIEEIIIDFFDDLQEPIVGKYIVDFKKLLESIDKTIPLADALESKNCKKYKTIMESPLYSDHFTINPGEFRDFKTKYHCDFNIDKPEDFFSDINKWNQLKEFFYPKYVLLEKEKRGLLLNPQTISALESLLDFFNRYFGIYYKLFKFINNNGDESNNIYLKDVKLKLVKIL